MAATTAPVSTTAARMIHFVSPAGLDTAFLCSVLGGVIKMERLATFGKAAPPLVTGNATRTDVPRGALLWPVTALVASGWVLDVASSSSFAVGIRPCAGGFCAISGVTIRATARIHAIAKNDLGRRNFILGSPPVICT